jgi:hypothetical protein
MELGTLMVLLSLDPAAAAVAPLAVAPRDSIRGAPEPARLAAVRADVGPHLARVTCTAGAFELPKVQMDSTGIWSANAALYHAARPALIVAGEVPEPKLPPRPIAWSTIDSVEVGRSQWKKGAAFGVVLGLVSYGLTLGASQSIAESSGMSGAAASWLWLGTNIVAGTVVGAIVMSPTKHWRTVFRRGDRGMAGPAFGGQTP